MDHLPPHVRLFASPEVWMESVGIDQLAAVARDPACRRAVGMPDLHPGAGFPIGAAFLFDDVVVPDLVGGDVGCGVLLLVGHRDGPRGDALERRIRAAYDDDVLADVDRVALVRAALGRGPRALVDAPGLPASFAALVERFVADEEIDDVEIALPEPELRIAAEQLGTIGAGNHFAEVSRIDRIDDRAAARSLSVTVDAQAVLVHSGSRATGAAFHRRHAGRRYRGADSAAYLGELRALVRYARTNRWVVALRLLAAAGLASASRVATVVDLVHNDVGPAYGGFLHRKGAAPAEEGAPTVVLGSRGAPSYLLRGLGNVDGLCCVAHGAGRRMTRGESVAKLGARYTRASLTRTAIGSRIVCDEPSLMYEEHPDAYKPVGPVIASLEAGGLAARVASLVPLVTVKR